MTKNKLKHRFNNVPEKTEKRKSIGKALSGLPLLLSACASKNPSENSKEMELLTSLKSPKIIDHEDGTQSIEGLEESMSPFRDGGLGIGIEDLTVVALAVLVIRFSITKSSKRDKNRDEDRG